MRHALARATRQTFRWTGRSGRSELWWPVAVWAGLAGAAGLWGIDALGVVLIVLTPTLASAAIRRLHDRGKSAWTLAAALILATVFLLSAALSIVPVLMLGAAAPTTSFVALAAAGLLALPTAGAWGYLLVVLALPGTAGGNRYGPPTAMKQPMQFPRLGSFVRSRSYLMAVAVGLVFFAAVLAVLVARSGVAPGQETIALVSAYPEIPEHHALIVAGLRLHKLAVKAGSSPGRADDVAVSYAISLWTSCIFDTGVFSAPDDSRALFSTIRGLAVRSASDKAGIAAYRRVLHGRSFAVPDTDPAVCAPDALAAAALTRPLWHGHGAVEYADTDNDGVYDQLARIAWRAGYTTGDAYWVVRLGAIAIGRAIRSSTDPPLTTLRRTARGVALFEHCARAIDPEGAVIFGLVIRSWMLDTPAREITWELWRDAVRASGEPAPRVDNLVCHERTLGPA